MPAFRKPINYRLKRWDAFTRFLDDGASVLVEQRRRTCAARHCDDRFILHLLFKCLKTLRSVFRN